MPNHHFGIMQKAPCSGERYDLFEPEKYNCISVDDRYILPLCKKLNMTKSYWHTLDRPEYGLAYWGITLIPPESLDSVIQLIWRTKELSELAEILIRAQHENKYVIHFGV